MIREGKDEDQIINNIKEMQSSLKFSEPFNYTKFKYLIKSDISRECVKLGIAHFKKHIYNVLINCPDIKSIKLIEDDIQTTFYVKEITHKKQYDNVSIYQYQINSDKEKINNNDSNNDNDNCYDYNDVNVNNDNDNGNDVNDINNTREYIVAKNNDISISVEYTKNMIIPKDEDEENLYTVFPLVGSSAHVLPFAINCHNFEPTTERNALILDGELFFNDKETKVFQNRKIFEKSIDLFDKLVDFLKESQCSNMVELAIGLLLSTKPYSSFDMNWYKDNFLDKLKVILSNKVEVKTISNMNLPLKDILIPDQKIDDEFIQEFIQLSVTKKYYPKMICIEDLLIWKTKIWDSLHFVTIDDLINEIINDAGIFDEMEKLNEFYSFIYRYKKELFDKYKLIPDMKNTLHSLSRENFRRCKTVPEDIINILQDIMQYTPIDWKSSHMNNSVDETIFINDIPEDKTIDAENKIIEIIKNKNSLSFNLMKFVLKNDMNRENMFYFVTELKMVNFDQKYIVENINQSIWNIADDFVLRQIVDKIGSLNANINIDFFMKFIPFFKTHFIGDVNFKSAKIIPTANYDKNHILKSLDDLYNKSEVFHDHLNSVIIPYCNSDLNDLIIHPNINRIIQSDKDEDILMILNDIIIKGFNNQIASSQTIIAESVISMIPKDDNSLIPKDDNSMNPIYDNSTSLLIFEYCKLFVNNNLSEISISYKLHSEKEWSFFNNFIVNDICKAIENNAKSLIEFQNRYSLNELKAFEILNFLCNYKSLKEYNPYQIIPNQEGEFRLKQDLETNPGLDDQFYKLFSKLNPNSQIHKKVVHSSIKIENIKKFDIQDFLGKLNNSIEKALNDENDEEKNKKVDEIKKFLSFDVKKFAIYGSMGMDDKMEVLYNTHISFIYQRIKYYSSPSDFDYQRWPFELIQNATDCIHKDEIQQSENYGKMIFEFNNNNVTFIHYGCAFSNENLISLLYQYGGGKEGTKSIGRFGTGFLSTLVLSRSVTVSGDLISEDSKKTGFEFKIDRTGNSKEELKNGINKMKSHSSISTDPKNETKFVFDINMNNRISKRAFEEGLKNLKQNIPQVLIFNSSIKSITIKYNNSETVYSREEENNTPIKSVKIKSDGQTSQRSYIYSEICNKFSYTHPFENKTITKDVKINCIVEVGHNNNIIYNDEFLYLAFPIFGNKTFKSNIIINSLDFEPMPERNDLVLKVEDNNRNSFETSINKFIILKTSDVFNQILQIAIEHKCTDMFNLFKGINKDSDNKFYQENFIVEMRNKIKNFSIFETSQGFKKFNEVLIPCIKEQHSESNYEEYYNLISKLSIKGNEIKSCLPQIECHFVKYEQCKDWLSSLWESFEPIIFLHDFLSYIGNRNNVNELQYKENKISFINDIIQFLVKLTPKIQYFLNNYKILLNMKCDFAFQRNLFIFKLPEELNEIITDLLGKVEYNYTDYIIHPEIKNIILPIVQKLSSDSQFQDFDLKKAINIVKDRINENNYINLMKFTISGDEKREVMFKLSKKYLNSNLEEDNFDIKLMDNCHKDIEEMFKRIDTIACKKMIEIIEKMEKQYVKENINDILNFALILKDNDSGYKSKKIFPSQLYALHELNELQKDNICDENIKAIVKETLNYDIKEFLIENSFSDFLFKSYDFYKLSDDINIKCFGNDENEIFNKMDENDCLRICSMVLSNANIYDLSTIKEITGLLNFFYNQNINLSNNKKKYFSTKLTQKIEKNVIIFINKFISKYTNINDIGLPIEELFNQLPILYYYSIKFNCTEKIFPNNSGVLMKFDEIQIIYDSQVPNSQLYEIINYINKFDDSKNSNLYLHRSIKIINKLRYVLSSHNKIIDICGLAERSPNDKILHYYKQDIDESSSEIDKKNKLYAEEFVKLIRKVNRLSFAFSEMLSKIENRSYINDIESIQKILKLFEKQIKLADEMKKYSNDSPNKLYLMKVIIYEKLKNSYEYSAMNKNKLFKNIECLFLSQSNSGNVSINYDGNDYMINEGEHKCDIIAEDSFKHKFYLVIKLEKDFQLNKEECQLYISSMLPNSSFNFVIILIDDMNNASLKISFKNNF